MNVFISSFIVGLLAVAAQPVSPLGSPASSPARKLKVVATLRDLEDITRKIGGDRVETKAITRGRENIHRVLLKPSHLVAVERADAFVQVGLSLEHSFVPGLLFNTRNEKLQPGEPGLITVSEGWTDLLQVSINRSRQLTADAHPQGNPHINLHPEAGRYFADRILDNLCRVEPASKDAFEKRHAAYVEELTEAEARWKKLAGGFAGGKVVMYHQDFNYFADAYGIEVVGALEPRPGLPPTPRHLADLVKLMRSEGVTVILTAAWSNNRFTAEVAKKTGATVVELPVMVGGAPGADSWISMMDFVHRQLAEVFPPPPPGPRSETKRVEVEAGAAK